MRRPPYSWALALARQALMRAAVHLLGARHAAWAQAMQVEAAAVNGEREALAFAWGCFVTALGHALAATREGLGQVHHAGVLACSTTVLIGCAFMHTAGAPDHYVALNLASLALAVATFRLVPLRRVQADELLRARLSFAMGTLLLLVSLGQAATGPSGWLRISGLPLNLAWLLVPGLLVAADLPSRSNARPWALAGLWMAGGALALQSDAALLALVAAVLSLRSWHHRSGALALLALATWAAAAHLGRAWQAPEALPFVDLVPQGGFERGPATGLALALLQLLPLWPALRHPQARIHGLVWGLLVAWSWPGWLPSVLVGFGGSFILAYLLSLALLGPATPEPTAAGPRMPAAGRRRDTPPLPRAGLT